MEFTETGQVKMSGDVLKSLAGNDERVNEAYKDLVKRYEDRCI